MAESPTTLKRILLVDDDPGQIKLLEKILANSGYEVITAQDASLGLQWVIDKRPALVILDVMMPIINGYNFCRIVKSEMKQKDIAIILLTSRDKLEDIQIGMDMGADAYLIKPVHTDELLRTIKVVESMQHKR